MLKQFAEHYRPSDEDFLALWQDAIFSFDANVLLDIYRFSLQSRDELLNLMTEYRERIWIPHQAAYEFHDNRLTVIDEVHKTSDSLLQGIQNLLKLINDDCKQHPYLTTELVSELKPNLEMGLSKISAAKTQHPDLISDDSLGRRIAQILDGRVGSPYSAKQRKALNEEIDRRYAEEIPPGYLDVKKKSKEGARGDAIVWLQMINYAKTQNKSIIFVTRDSKDDWWLRHAGKTLQPRPELRREFTEKTGHTFYAYTTSRFIQLANENLGKKISEAFIAEAEQLADNSAPQWPDFIANESLAFEINRRLRSKGTIDQAQEDNQLPELEHARFQCRAAIERLQTELTAIQYELFIMRNSNSLNPDKDFQIFASLMNREQELTIELQRLLESELEINRQFETARMRGGAWSEYLKLFSVMDKTPKK
jgi:hypothetical protein